MPKGETLTPYDVSIIHDLVAWAQDQDHDEIDGLFLSFLVRDEDEEDSVDLVRESLERIHSATEDWF